ncbi:MAG: aminotransferase class IV, partial [Desulfobacterales bacterium]|nr:aminotransferase class IV [Desulfobacterales bacterium]
KIRGFRVEPGEIEKQILKLDAIRQACVLAREAGENHFELTAYITADVPMESNDLRDFLKLTLPDYSIPVFFTQLEKMPLNPNGKIDRNALPAPDAYRRSSGETHIPPLTETEKRLAQIWESVLGQLICQNGFEPKTCAVKLLVARDGRPGRNVFAAAFIRTYVHRLEMLGKEGLDLISFPHARHSFLADHKSMNYLFYDRARAFALEHGADESLILNSDGTVSETNTCNIFALEGKNIIVPDSRHVLNGITLGSVIKIMQNKGFTVSHVSADVETFCLQPYVFVTNALMGMVPVRRIDKTLFDMDSLLCRKVNEVLFPSC